MSSRDTAGYFRLLIESFSVVIEGVIQLFQGCSSCLRTEGMGLCLDSTKVFLSASILQ